MDLQSRSNQKRNRPESISDLSDDSYVPEPLENHEDVHHHLISDFITGADLIIENKTSEPRDFLMTERTTLSWVKFCAMLMLCSIALTLNYRLDTDGSRNNDGNSPEDGADPISTEYRIKFGISLSMVGMGIGCVILSTLNYFKAIYSYQRERIKTYSTELTTISLAFLIVTLLVINILLIYFDN